jgi:hypothetical protein
LNVIRGQLGVSGPFVVADMRFFVGPEVAWILSPRPPAVRRWYVKAFLRADPAFRGRFIVEDRGSGREGVSGVAPYDTLGFVSPDWRAFTGEGSPRVHPGLPGAWAGVGWDFVTGAPEEPSSGLPKDNIGCMAGT